MDAIEYNYGVFTGGAEEFNAFATDAPKATMHAPSFPLDELASGETVEMKSLWQRGVTILEFGSFT